MDNDLFFFTSKIFWILLNPVNVLIFINVISTALLWSGWEQWAKVSLSVSLAMVILMATFPVGAGLSYLLEKRFPTPASLPDEITGIVLLGGGINLGLSRQLGYPALNTHAHRLFTALDISKRYPDARLYFTGHSGELQQTEMGEADFAQLFFEQHGLGGKVQYEKRARNTYENALYTKALAQPQAGENWILITSAAHIPRSVGVFRHIGWQVIPFPANTPSRKLAVSLPSLNKLHASNQAIKEWLGLTVYFLTGKTDSWLPSA